MQKYFYPFITDDGIFLNEENIGFATAEIVEHKKTLQDYGIKSDEKYLTMKTKGVRSAKKTAYFPSSVRHKKSNVIFPIKVDPYGNKLPIHAGCCEQIKIALFANPYAGKTTYLCTTLLNPEFHNLLARCSKLSFGCDSYMQCGMDEFYETERRRLLEEKKYPGVTHMGQKGSFHYLVEDGERRVKKLLSITDYSGEDCLRISDDSIILNKYFFIMIAADDILSGRTSYVETVVKLINRIKTQRDDKDYTFIIMITKADLMDWQDPMMKRLSRNTLSRNTLRINDRGSLFEVLHQDGFDIDNFSNREKCIKALFKHYAPNFYNLLRNNTKGHVRFCMVASIGSKSEGLTYNRWNPYCIEEPYLCVLSKEGMFKKNYGISKLFVIMEETIYKLAGGETSYE